MVDKDKGGGGVIGLTDGETGRRWKLTPPKWHIMHAVLYGISRDQLMAKHKANHVQVAYAPNATTALQALIAKASMAKELGLQIHLCGTLEDDLSYHQRTEQS